MQIYRGMDIGTAKPTSAEQALIPHHQLDVRNPDEHYSAGQYARDAEVVLREIAKRDHLPILVGGSGLYYRALVYGLDPMPEIPVEIRDAVIEEWERFGPSACYARLVQVDPVLADRLSPHDKVRIQRGLEVHRATGRPLSSFQRQQQPQPRFPILAFGLHWERDVLYQRINQRADVMLSSGWIDEVEELLKTYPPTLPPIQALGYRQIVAYLSGAGTRSQLLEEIQQKTRNFAKRQGTWFRKEQVLQWILPGRISEVQEQTKRFIQRNFAK